MQIDAHVPEEYIISDVYKRQLKDNGMPIEYISQKIGFRKVEIKDGIIRINGQRVVFKGTNRHEFD